MMKTRQLKFLAVSVLSLLIGFTSCSNEEDPVGPLTPETGSLMISFKASELTTRAINKTATVAERALKTVHAFVYKNDQTLEKVAKFTLADFTQNGDSYSLKDGKQIDGLVVGAKSVTLGVNLPDELVAKIQSAGSIGMTSAHVMDLADLTDETNGYVMFSKSKTANVAAGTTSSVSGTFSVDRIVAKTSVKIKPGTSMIVAGGKITGMTYDVQNINSVIYPFVPSAFDKTTINDQIPDNFKQVEVMPADDEDDTYHTYMTEYKPQLPLVSDSYPTYIRIRCAFVPTRYVINEDGTTSNADYTGGVFWTLPLKDGTVAYFINETIAQSYFDNNKDLILNADTNDYTELVSEYADGNVDYGVFLHKTMNGFDVVRNNYYIISISGINGLGEPSDTPQIDPKEKGSLVSFELTINDWEGVESDDEQIS